MAELFKVTNLVKKENPKDGDLRRNIVVSLDMIDRLRDYISPAQIELIIKDKAYAELEVVSLKNGKESCTLTVYEKPDKKILSMVDLVDIPPSL